MNLGDYIVEKLDVDKNGKVRLADAVAAAEKHFGATAVRWAFFGFIAGVSLAGVLFYSFRA